MTAQGPDWSRTHALVVAVEEYAEGGDWCLDGPAQDAANMIDWLTGQGMPLENVHLLASPRPKNKHLLDAVGLATYDQVNQATIRQLLRHRLADLAGDWLWVYWAGHGVQAKGSQWSLLYPEARSNDLIGLDAGDLVDLLQSDRLNRDFRRVAVIIDACRQPLSAREQMNAADPDRLLGTATIQKARQIFAMHACEPGGLAKNREGEGLFTRVLLSELATENRSDAGPDLDAVWGRVHDKFKRLRDSRRAQQIPTMSVRNWAGDRQEFTFATRPPLDPNEQQLFLAVTALVDGTPGAAAACGARLSEELGITPTSEGVPTARDLVGWALRTHHGIATLLHVLAETTGGGTSLEDARRTALILRPGEWLLRAEYDELAELLGEDDSALLRTFVRAAHNELPGVQIGAGTVQAAVEGLEVLLHRPPSPRQLLRVVERAAAAVPEPDRGALRAWSDRCAERSGTVREALLTSRAYAEERADAIRPATTDFEYRIQIKLSPQTDKDQRRTYQIWAARTGHGVESLAKVDSPSLPEDIRLRLDDLLVEHGRVHETLVEFFLPSDELDLDVHRWGITTGTRLERPLGMDYPVVVRPAEQRPKPFIVNYRRRWDRVAASTTNDLHWLPEGLGEDLALYRALSEQPNAPGVVMTAPPRARPRAQMFAVCVHSGIPVMVWHRGEERRTTKSQLESVLSDGHLPSLPHRLREFRCGRDLGADRQGKHLALLWDDPDLPLPRPLALSAPM